MFCDKKKLALLTQGGIFRGQHFPAPPGRHTWGGDEPMAVPVKHPESLADFLLDVRVVHLPGDTVHLPGGHGASPWTSLHNSLEICM